MTNISFCLEVSVKKSCAKSLTDDYHHLTLLIIRFFFQHCDVTFVVPDIQITEGGCLMCLGAGCRVQCPLTMFIFMIEIK